MRGFVVYSKIVRMRHGADVEGDEATQTTAISEDFDGAFDSGLRINDHNR